MSALVVSFSKFGNTRRIAESIAQALAQDGSVRVLDMDQFSEADVYRVDLVVMGCPTHRMNLPETVRPLLNGLPRRALRGISIAAFDTSYKMSWWLAHFTAARKLDKKLRRLGGKRAVPPQTFHVEAREGPLYDGEIERAKTWANTIRSSLVRSTTPRDAETV